MCSYLNDDLYTWLQYLTDGIIKCLLLSTCILCYLHVHVHVQVTTTCTCIVQVHVRMFTSYGEFYLSMQLRTLELFPPPWFRIGFLEDRPSKFTCTYIRTCYVTLPSVLARHSSRLLLYNGEEKPWILLTFNHNYTCMLSVCLIWLVWWSCGR